MDEIRSAAATIAGRAVQVNIDRAQLKKLAGHLARIETPDCLKELWGGGEPRHEHDDIHFFDGTDRTVMYLLVLNAVNFCFWPSAFTVEYGGRVYGTRSRYQALAAALTRAFREGEPLWEADFLRGLAAEDMRRVFRTESGEVPLLDRRLAQLRNLGETLSERFGGSALAVLEAAGRNAPDLARLLRREFSCYRDERDYRGIIFPALKRAQLFASDVSLMFGNRGLGRLEGLDGLTCFADYRLPQYMRDRGALAYSAELDRRIAVGEELPEGSDEEIEIRANTVHAVELLSGEMAAAGIRRTAREIDYLIWEDRVRIGELSVRHHRTVTTGY